MRKRGGRKAVERLKMAGKAVCAVLTAALLLGSAWRIYRVNAEYPPAEKLFIGPGEEYALNESVTVRTGAAEWLNRDELEERYGEGLGLLEGYDFKGVVIPIILKNVSTRKTDCPLYQFYLETEDYYCNGMDMEMYMLENGMTMELALEPGEEKTLYLTYSLSGVQFTKKQWEQVETKTCYLVNERYPKKIYWEAAGKEE